MQLTGDQTGADTNNSNGTKLPKFKTTAKFPDYIPQDIGSLYDLSKKYDNSFYNASDADFATRHPALKGAENLFEQQTLKDQQGNSELMPAIQNAFLTSGLEKSLGSFGDLGTTLAPGSAAEASVGRSLAGPEGILGFQNMNRQNRQQSLGLAETLFPHRQIGFGGETATDLSVGNNENKNIYAMGKYGDQFGADKINWEINAENIRNRINQGNADQQASATTSASDAAASAQKKQAIIAGTAAIAGAVIIAF